jgi:hypothetical protein
VPDVSRKWLAAAVTISATLVLSAPFIGQIRTSIRDAVGARFSTVMAAAVGGLVAAAAWAAVVRIKERRAARFTALALTMLIGIGYALLTRTGNAEVDAVERFHFLEYGLVTFLYYRAWRGTGDVAVLVLPMLAGIIVGTCEEWLQWFIPVQVGEVRDVLLNLVAIACGLLFSLSLDPPSPFVLTRSPTSRRRMLMLGATTLAVFAAFFHVVHLGYEIKDAEAGVFRSRYTAGELAALSDARARAWAAHPPLTWSRLSREDQYFSEGVAHVQHRNETWAEGNVMASRHENLILEQYYAPVLDTPSYLSAAGHRWPAAQRADAESRIGPGFMIYLSDALPSPVFIWPKWLFWVSVAVPIAVMLRAALRD